MMEGKIIKGIGGFYYVDTGDSLYECRAKGTFRKEHIKPAVGDNVAIQVLDEGKKLGNLEEILPRRNSVIRPTCSNVDQAIVVFAVTNPTPNLNLLDRFLVMMEWQNVPTAVCFNKTDIGQDEEIAHLVSIYEKAGIQTFAISTKDQVGLEQVRESLIGKTTILAGPSGVGKSSLVNWLHPDAEMETGQVSEKIKRGRHTTRHSELFRVQKHTYIMDTPGFSNLRLPEIEKEELRFYFPEFQQVEGECRFQGCVHLNEPQCKVKGLLADGEISKERYENYKQMFEEIKEFKKY